MAVGKLLGKSRGAKLEAGTSRSLAQTDIWVRNNENFN